MDPGWRHDSRLAHQHHDRLHVRGERHHRAEQPLGLQCRHRHEAVAAQLRLAGYEPLRDPGDRPHRRRERRRLCADQGYQHTPARHRPHDRCGASGPTPTATPTPTADCQRPQHQRRRRHREPVHHRSRLQRRDGCHQLDRRHRYERRRELCTASRLSVGTLGSRDVHDPRPWRGQRADDSSPLLRERLHERRLAKVQRRDQRHGGSCQLRH